MTLRVTECRTEYLINPLGLDTPRPRLFWKLVSDKRGAVQSAYRVLVATSPEKLNREEGDLWDSGKVESRESAHIVYDGTPLKSGQQCWWKVRVWDGDGLAGDWSEPAFWTMGLLSREEWKARLIGRRPESGSGRLPAPYFRKEVRLRSGVRRATAWATALGLYELRVNGRRVSAIFAPGWTDYDKRLQVQAYEIGELLQAGANAFGVILGEGWYSGTVGFLGDKVYGERPFFMMQVHIEYEDGTTERIITDGTWKTIAGPIRYADLVKGEEYDARLERDGWDQPGFDDADWEEPDVRPGYNGLLTATVEPPIRITKTMRPVSMHKTERGTYIYDMGQNMVGWTEVRVRGARGTRITLSHAEVLNPDGSLYLDNLRLAVQQDHYILKGEGEEQYEPHFTFHGFRYVELIGYPGEPDLDTVTGKVVHSDTPPAGTIETDNEMVNKLFSNIVWGQRGNFLSVPTDCPQRDERLGWTGDAQIFARTASYNMDVSRFFTKFVQDMVDCQQPSGAFTDVAPDAGWIRHKMWNTRLNWYAPDNAGWGDAGVIIPWTLYLMYGDTRILEIHYEAMARWIAYLKANSDGLIRPDYSNYGDWLSIDADTPKDVLATAYFAYSTRLMARIAEALGKPDEQARYEALYREIAAAFRAAFVDENGRIKGDTQTVYVLALQFDLLTEELRGKAIGHLVADIERRGGCLSTGFLGVGYLLPALTEGGRLDVAYRLLVQDKFPSWMYSIRHGATTIWERWDGWTEEKGFQDPSMNSFNHYSLGSVGEWMYRYMAGIEADPAHPGFARAIIRPRPGGPIREVKAAYESLRGPIRVEWNHGERGAFRLRVEIPANAEAVVEVPGSAARCLAESGWSQVSESSAGVKFHIGSGEYHFESFLDVQADNI